MEAPLLSPTTPRTLSESGPNHGLSSAHDTSFGNVFVSEENDEDEVLEKDDADSEKRSEEKSSDDGLVESEENMKADDEDSMLLENGSEKTPKFRGRRESHV